MGSGFFAAVSLGLKRSAMATRFSSASATSLQLHSSISLPRGARPTYFTFVTWRSSLRIRSPPLSPSRRAVASFSLVRRFMDSGTFAPSSATVFVMPHRMRLMMSALPSTMIISLLVSRVGPAGRSSGPYFSTLPAFMVSLISL